MPASRILEGRLPEQHPSAHIFFGSQPQPPTANGAKTGYQGRSPWLVRVDCFEQSLDLGAWAFSPDRSLVLGFYQCKLPRVGLRQLFERFVDGGFR